MKQDTKTTKNSVKTGKDEKKPVGREIGYANLIPGANKKGRPKGKLNYNTRFDLAVDFLAEQLVLKHNADPKNKNKQLKLDDVDINNDLFAQAIQKARNGSEKMLIDIFDRRYGKATQPIELSGKDGDPIQYEIEMKEAEGRLKKFQNKWFKKK
jgi:phosphoribosylformylglycinamidine (FGAM) synthase-like enzyme